MAVYMDDETRITYRELLDLTQAFQLRLYSRNQEFLDSIIQQLQQAECFNNSVDQQRYREIILKLHSKIKEKYDALDLEETRRIKDFITTKNIFEELQENGCPQPKICAVCNESFVPQRKDAIYCSAKCKQIAYRERKQKALKEAPNERPD